MEKQKTVANSISFEGTGVHSGGYCTVTVKPAPAGSGIKFARSDIDPSLYIDAGVNNVVDTRRSTSIGLGGIVVHTVEHLMAALYSAGITNCIIEVSGPEVPILDGSAKPIIDLLQTAGFKEQEGYANYAKVNQSFTVIDDDSSLSVAPSDNLFISFVVSYPGTPVGTQLFTYIEGVHEFQNDIASARTLGFTWEIDELRKRGLAIGGSIECAVVADSNSYISPLRYDDEVVRHKIMDLIGDMYLIGRPQMRLICIKSGHKLTNKLCRELIDMGYLDVSAE